VKTSLRTHLRARGRLIALGLVLGAASHACGSFPRERTLEAVSELCGAASGTEPSEAAWEPSRGALLDLVDGRGFLFVGRAGEDKTTDVHRAMVRVTPDGAPLTVTRTRNLTRTALADERALRVHGSHAMFATVAFGEVRNVTLLDFEGAPAQHGSLAARLVFRAERAVTSFLSTGTPRGIGRTDFELSPPQPELALVLSETELELSSYRIPLTGPDEKLRAALRQTSDVRVSVLERGGGPLPLSAFFATTGRAIAGDQALTTLDGTYLAARDRLKRVTSTLFGGGREQPSPNAHTAAERAATPESHPWPPRDIASPWQSPRAGEGHWAPLPLPSRKPKPGAAPYFYRTFVRPDRERPYADVVLVALDMRRLELGVSAGYETPAPSAGPPGSGRIPSGVSPKRVVATFNGGQRDLHGELGMIVERRVLAPPIEGAASVRIDRTGRVGVGAWPAESAPSESAGAPALPADLVSLRQSLGPLLQGGSSSVPAKLELRTPSLRPNVTTERSALCVTHEGHLLYAWSAEITLSSLTEGLKMAGCENALALDTTRSCGAFSLTDVTRFDPLEAHAELVDARMQRDELAFLRGSPTDFFYVTLRDEAPRGGAYDWHVDAGAQPPPTGLAAIFSARQSLGTLSLELWRFEQGRFTWAVGPSEREAAEGVVEHELPSEQKDDIVAGIGLGYTTDRTRYGLAVRGRIAVPLQRALATLVLPAKGAPYAVPNGVPLSLPADAEAIQLPVLARDGALTPRAQELGAQRSRGALCLDPAGNLLVARIKHDSSAPAARALLELGCTLVLEMDRGSHSTPTVERTGTPTPPGTQGSTTLLYALAREPEPRAYAFSAESKP
jgi:hypothetical protein